MVKDGEISNIEEVFASKQRIQDIQIIQQLIPDLEETVLDVKRVQRQTDAGRKTTFAAIAVVGNRNGIVGVGSGRDVGMGTAIRAAIQDAKLNIIPVKRGSGTWEDSTSELHSIPFKVTGSCASVRVTLIPAPRGTGLVTGEVAKKVLRLAGVKDIWSQTIGDTRTSANYVKAVFEALKKTYHTLLPSEWS
jgi:small subunit ribosomal protein S5